MAFHFQTLRDQQAEGEQMAGGTKAQERICRAVDGELVRENDPRGVRLAYPVGEPIAAAEVDAYNQLIADEAAEDGTPEPEPEKAEDGTPEPEPEKAEDGTPEPEPEKPEVPATTKPEPKTPRKRTTPAEK